MASSTALFSLHRLKQVWPTRFNYLPFLSKRCGAWAAEVSLIVASGLIPFAAGVYIQSVLPEKRVPLNPVLSTTQLTVAKTLAIPLRERNIRVSPWTNLLWTAAFVSPLLVAGWQIYLLGRTGKTLPKRWFNLQVVTNTGHAPGIGRVLWREGTRWGGPLGVSYLIWWGAAAIPHLGIFTGLVAIFFLADGVYALFNRHHQCLHDSWAGTFVQEAEEGILTVAPQDSLELSDSVPEDSAIASLLTKDTVQWSGFGLWAYRHPGIAGLLCLGTVVGSFLLTFVGTQIYAQDQENWRVGKKQENERFLQLLAQFSTDQKRGAILGMGSLGNPDAEVIVLTDLLNVEKEDQQLQAIAQALVSAGPKSLPYIQRLNISLRNDLEEKKAGLNKEAKQLLLSRLIATQKAINKILILDQKQAHSADLSRTNLGQIKSPARFNLVLDRLDLTGINLKGAIVSGASFQGTRFSGAGADNVLGTFDDEFADLSGAELKEANLSQALLTGVSLNNASLIRAYLHHANLVKALLNGANLSSANLIGASLREASLKNARLTGADLRDASFRGATLQGGRLAQVKATGASFQGANLTQTVWQGADLTQVNFSKSSLDGADFSSASLEKADLRGALLRYASFKSANLVGVDFRGANLAGADFAGAILVVEQPRKGNEFIKRVSKSNSLSGLKDVDFSQVKNLNIKQIGYICSQGGLHPKCSLKSRLKND